MAFFRQTWTLTKKNLLVVFVRHWFFTSIRAFWAPIIFMFFISYAKNFFVPPSQFGIGHPILIRSLGNALNSAQGNRNTVVFVNNGHIGGDIERVINDVSATVRTAGKTVKVVEQDVDLLTTCASSLRGASTCFGAISFHSSPTEGVGGGWNYTLRADGAFGERIFVDRTNNDVEIYVLPFQHAVDAAIGALNGTNTQKTINEYPFTDQTSKERDTEIRRLYMGALINILAVAYYIGICGVTYQLTGQMASEREAGVSQLVEAMTPVKKPWHIQAARLLSNHLSFDIIYLPGWILMAVILARLNFPETNVGILIIFHILAGLSLSSFSIFGASFFHKAQLSGITITIGAIILAIIAQVAGPFNTAAVAVLSLLFPPINYVFFVIYVARWQRVAEATNLVKAAPNFNSTRWTLPGIAFWIFLIIQIVVYPILGALVERWLYGTVSKDRKTTTSSSDYSIVLSSFSKHWAPSWFRTIVLSKIGIKPPETVFAVNDLSIKARKGQIMVLLGANGSGKSTTLDAISGLNTITSGSIEIDGTGGLGLCPQKNVMWDELTVFEHVQIFNRLKSPGAGDDKTAIKNLVRVCDLSHKLKAKSSTLSGGQKRKLQLAMMFTGGSRVCCVDEVSSGLDPLSRRKIWDILLSERGERTFLLTTHFLDEADILSDYIAILSRGNLKTKGTSVQLKHQVGAGYHVTMPKDQRFLPLGGVRKQSAGDRLMYWFSSAAETSRFVDQLRKNGVKDYDIIGPTLEDVFLALAEEVKEDGLATDTTSIEGTARAKSADTIPPSDDSSEVDKGLHMSNGEGTSMAEQTWILIQKRFTILRRNYLPYAAAALLPIITAGLVTFFLDGFKAVGCDPGDQASHPKVFNIQAITVTPLIPVGPSSLVDLDLLAKRSGLNNTAFHVVNSLNEFNDYVATTFRNITPGGFFLQENAPPTMAYVGNGNILGGLITLNALSNTLTNIPISTQYQAFAVPFAPGTGKTLQLILYFGLAMSVYPAFFALYPTVERLRKVRALHFSNGIRAAPLWLAYLIFDFVFVLAISAIVMGIFIGVSSVWYAPGYLFVVFFLYGLTSILLCYVVSLVVTSQLAAFAFAAGGQACFFLIYFVIDMCILTYSPAYRINSDLTLSHFVYSTVTPAGNLIRSLLLTLNEFSLLCNDESIAAYPGALKVYGGPILYLIVQAIVLFITLVWWDSGYKPPVFTRSKSRAKHSEEDIDAIDPAVAAEMRRVEQSSDSLRVLHLHKTFGRNHAVNNITFGVPQGEVFALLGPNGAGKSSTISLIRGDIHPSRNGGDICIEGISVIAKRATARGHLGVCPQFDAMDAMTVREHLAFYARTRGVTNIQSNIDAVLAATGLIRFSDRLAHNLSGGNKRKLSLGIALMGNPSVLLLDEPSSGMDAAAKRVMWRTLLGVAAPGRALLITTHSMEEADKLATRVGIMKRKMLALGSVAELGDQYGDAWVVQLVLKSAPETREEEMSVVREWVKSRIPGVQVERWGSKGGGHGQLRFRVLKAAVAMSATSPGGSVAEKEATDEIHEVDAVSRGPAGDNGGGIPGLIHLLEEYREELGLEHYSVSPTTLDEVFLRVVGEEEEEDGNVRKGNKKGSRMEKWRLW
ncbi:P-loop containing nucleoside triphosphate hydrolase protein [Lindgomyces ingoldianus]|uniref:P-loop containing nucleoside triphosphate hydrolase protein n=1 Tax=Lindgomyces ingoldianus TaxID=673940 RepID=A0ACB6R584_9PLEO|nr:P-loop containing nucleoside triphosphate hydrolase protein [Lindgomyces ingoldianus]KAF2474469.1 P-loop containing nucleoside triphosphate hydrolase protein [Lindgomyces ingoldianus]